MLIKPTLGGDVRNFTLQNYTIPANFTNVKSEFFSEILCMFVGNLFTIKLRRDEEI